MQIYILPIFSFFFRNIPFNFNSLPAADFSIGYSNSSCNSGVQMSFCWSLVTIRNSQVAQLYSNLPLALLYPLTKRRDIDDWKLSFTEKERNETKANRSGNTLPILRRSNVIGNFHSKLLSASYLRTPSLHSYEDVAFS